MTALHEQALFTADVARAYLRDQGFPVDDGDMLKLHMNAVTGFIQRYTGRDVLRYSATVVSEFRDGRGTSWIYTREAPIQNLAAITTYPYVTGVGETIVGPGANLGNDDMFYDRDKGRVDLVATKFPDGPSTVLLTYTAGWKMEGDLSATATDPPLAALQVIALEALLRKWQRWVEKRVGVLSRSTQAGSVSYAIDDFPEAVLSELKRYRRALAR